MVSHFTITGPTGNQNFLFISSLQCYYNRVLVFSPHMTRKQALKLITLKGYLKRFFYVNKETLFFAISLIRKQATTIATRTQLWSCHDFNHDKFLRRRKNFLSKVLGNIGEYNSRKDLSIFFKVDVDEQTSLGVTFW